ncbi:hypothetical protein H9L17_05895 [Thermomonas brevis]|uniref:Uncharacterized protein n=1 Tax=Thermomonas brevis TaxID=215691 RepID=A0A7G9QWD9_9GAMM|nr:hypothetical protein [Thermomonas brevis]QNN47664.1 hypothetical protein H9L17_05895 [Thermomonas brevis]
MTTHDREHDRTAHAIDAQRWLAQEQARRGDPDADAGDLRIARALRRAPPVDLPPDFATAVARSAAAQARARAEASTLLEQRLLRGLGFVFALSAAVVVAWYGRGWAAALAATLPGGGEALGWCAAAAVCLLGNWGLGAMKRRWVAPAF